MVTHTVIDRSWSALCGLAPLALMELQVELNEVMRFLPLGIYKDLMCTLPKLHLVQIHQQLEMEQEEEEKELPAFKLPGRRDQDPDLKIS
jgi:hypothetical protein